MPVKRPAALAILMLGVSGAALHAESGAPAALFGAPVRVDGAAVRAMQPAMVRAPQPANGPFALDRAKPPEGAGDGTAPVEDPSAGVDLSALRYYAHESDLARVAAEIRLLRARHPGWEPPTDLFSETRTGETEQPLWDLFGKHDYPGVHAAIEARRQRTPDWQPSADLTTKLALAEAYDAMVVASDGQDWGTVLDLAAANRGLMICANVDALWRTAEALAHTDDEPRATEVYRYVLSHCTNPQERLATIQKASGLLKAPGAVDELMRMGKRLANGTPEFEPLRLDAVRRRIGEAAAGKSETLPTQADLDQIAARAKTATGRDDAGLLGWYALSRKDFAQAETWFRLALQAGPAAKPAEGLVLALRDGGKLPEAAKLADQYASLGPLNRKLQIEIVTASLADPAHPPTPEQLASLGSAIDAEKSADAAQALGWARFKAEDVRTAQDWFRKSAEWQPSESAAIGLLVTARRLKQPAEFTAAAAKYKALYPRVAELTAVMATADRPQPKRSRGAHAAAPSRHRGGTPGEAWDQSATDIVQTFQNGQIDQALALMDARKARRAEPKGLSVVRGWAMYKRGDWDGAKRVFTDLNGTGMHDEAQKGLREIELGYTNPRLR